jgi:hypothetical protein
MQRTALVSAASAAVVLVSTAIAQATQPVIRNDVLYGLNRGAAAETTFHLRGPAVPLGGAKLPTTWAQGFIQAIQFDNTDGFRHAHFGNMLGQNFGTVANGGELFNMQTKRTVGDPTPGLAQKIFDFPTYNGSNPPLTVSRLAGLSVSPKNNRIAMTGNDSGLIYVFDYNAGANPGTGAGASVSNGREIGGLTPGASNTQGTAWLDNDNLLAVNSFGDLIKVTVGPGGVLSSAVVGSVPLPGAGAPFINLAYEPNLSPNVYISVGRFDSVLGTVNTIHTVNPNTFTVVQTNDYSATVGSPPVPKVNTMREMGFDSRGNLYISQFGNTSSTPLGGSVEIIQGANLLSNMIDNTSNKWYVQAPTALSAQFSGLDVASTLLDYKTAGVNVNLRDRFSVTQYWGPTPKNTIRGLLASGYNAGGWNGNGIFSSNAAADPNQITGIAYAEASDLGVIGGSFRGEDVPGNAIILLYTYNGDTDLNGVIDFDDYARIDTGFLTGGDEYFEGDFDYNGGVDFDDYALIDAAFLLQGGPLDGINGLVPEPTALSLVGLAGLALMARRRA